MKKHTWSLLLVPIFVAVVLITRTKKTDAPITQAPVVTKVAFSESRPYCFVFKQEATEGAPYSVEEHVNLARVRGAINGTKVGTQAGPDMTNGYGGTITATVTGEGTFDAVFAYTVEGSSNKELEEYSIDGENIVKHRYQLMEGKYDGVAMLVPDTSKPATEQTYVSEACQ